MDDLGNWVYIILMVVVGISSLFSSINKKKGQKQTQTPSPEIPDDRFPAPPVPLEPVPVPTHLPAKKIRKSSPPIPGNTGNKPFGSPLKSSLDETHLQTESAIKPDEDYSLAEELDLTDTEAFRKAIIYSEIINRRY